MNLNKQLEHLFNLANEMHIKEDELVNYIEYKLKNERVEFEDIVIEHMGGIGDYEFDLTVEPALKENVNKLLDILNLNYRYEIMHNEDKYTRIMIYQK